MIIEQKEQLEVGMLTIHEGYVYFIVHISNYSENVISFMHYLLDNTISEEDWFLDYCVGDVLIEHLGKNHEIHTPEDLSDYLEKHYPELVL